MSDKCQCYIAQDGNPLDGCCLLDSNCATGLVCRGSGSVGNYRCISECFVGTGGNPLDGCCASNADCDSNNCDPTDVNPGTDYTHVGSL